MNKKFWVKKIVGFIVLAIVITAATRLCSNAALEQRINRCSYQCICNYFLAGIGITGLKQDPLWRVQRRMGPAQRWPLET